MTEAWVSALNAPLHVKASWVGVPARVVIVGQGPASGDCSIEAIPATWIVGASEVGGAGSMSFFDEAVILSPPLLDLSHPVPRPPRPVAVLFPQIVTTGPSEPITGLDRDGRCSPCAVPRPHAACQIVGRLSTNRRATSPKASPSRTWAHHARPISSTLVTAFPRG